MAQASRWLARAVALCAVWWATASVRAEQAATDEPAAEAISLEQVMRLAQRDPPAVARAYAELLEAAAESRYARSQWLPAFSVDGLGGYGYDNQLVLPGVPRIDAHEITTRASMSLDWAAFDLARGARIDAARASEAARSYALDAERQAAALLAVELYLRAGAADELVEDAALSLRRRAQQHAATSDLVKAGTRSPVDAQRAKIELLSAEFTLGARKTERRAAFAALASAIGRSALAPVRPARNVETFSGLAASEKRARALALALRPELRGATAEIAARDHEHSAAVGERLPTLGALATGSFSYIDVRAGEGLPGDQFAGSAGVYVRWRGLDPEVWSKGGVAEAATTVATRERDALRQRIESEAVQAYFTHERMRTERERAVAILADAQIAREAQHGRYMAGVASLLELLDAEDLEQTARQRRIEATRDQAIAQVRLLAACGQLAEPAR